MLEYKSSCFITSKIQLCIITYIFKNYYCKKIFLKLCSTISRKGEFMRIKNVKPNISDYNFLRLLISTIIIRGEMPIFENQQLQKDLYAFYNNIDFYLKIFVKKKV